MAQQYNPQTVLHSLVVLILLTGVVATVSGVGTARTLGVPGNCTTSSLFQETCSQENETITTTADSSGTSEKFGICMIGVSSPCNGDAWENSSQLPTDTEPISSTGDPTETDAGETAVQFPARDFDVGFEPTVDDGTNSSATEERLRAESDGPATTG